MHTGFWCVSQKEKNHYEDLGVDDRKILKLLLEKKDGVVRIGLIWLSVRATDGLVWTR
jgi:hypothetical protein